MNQQDRAAAFQEPMKAKAILKYVPTAPVEKTDIRYLEDLARMIHRDNVIFGWWDAWPDREHRVDTALMLTVSELSEAMEGCRKGLKDDHLPHHDMFDVELADAMIRLLDLAGGIKLTFPLTMRSQATMMVHTWNKPRGHNVCATQVETLFDVTVLVATGQVQRAIAGVMALAIRWDVPLWQIVAEKRVYNLTRLDHKKENREAEGGKQF